MSLSQLGQRLAIGRVSAKRLEDREAAGTITLAALSRAAEAMGCELVYALVPRASLEEVLNAQARALARDRMNRVAHTMNLEAQGVQADELREQEQELANHFRNDWSRKLWSYTPTSSVTPRRRRAAPQSDD